MRKKIAMKKQTVEKTFKEGYAEFIIGLTPSFWTKPNKFFDFLRITPLPPVLR